MSQTARVKRRQHTKNPDKELEIPETDVYGATLGDLKSLYLNIEELSWGDIGVRAQHCKIIIIIKF